MKGFKICRIFGIDIKIDWSLIPVFVGLCYGLFYHFSRTFPALPFVMGVAASIASVALFYSSLVFHELAHSIVARRFDIRVKKITLFFLGGIVHAEDMTGESAKEEFFISAAGPASSFILSGIFFGFVYLVGSVSLLLFVLLTWLSYMNLALAVFNLFPIFPMDGGRIARSIIHWRVKNLLKATKYVAVISDFFSVMLVAVIAYLSNFNLWNLAFVVLILLWFIRPAGKNELYEIGLREMSKDLKVRDLFEPLSPLEEEGATEARDTCSLDDSIYTTFYGMRVTKTLFLYVKEKDKIIGKITSAKIQWHLTNNV